MYFVTTTTGSIALLLILQNSGVIRDIFDTCNGLCSHGMNRYKLESIIADMTWRSCSKREEKHCLAVKE